MRSSRWLAGGMLLFAVTALAQPEEGLILHYAFDEGARDVMRDSSGHRCDGQVVPQPGSPGKAEWVQEKNRTVLRFSGDIWIEVGTTANAMMGQRGTLETWCLPE